MSSPPGYNCSTVTYNVTTCGYPAQLDKNMSRVYCTQGTLNPFNGCLPKEDPAGVISSNLDASAGQSGSPIWQVDSAGYSWIRAIHNSEGPGHRTLVK